MKKIILIITFFLVILAIFTINFPIAKDKVYGKYANKNYEQPICCVEAPHKADTLILYKNGNFESKYFGNGTYAIGSSFETNIDIYYRDFGKNAIFRTYFENKIFKNPKIILNADTNHYYEKIE